MTEEIIGKADEELSKREEPPKSLSDFLSEVRKDPSIASDSVNYLLDAIEHFGTRDVVEMGEEKQRYCFFDDPYGNGEHAVLGNTEVLNEFVEELQRMASSEGENDRIIWFEGPTATGKSELKRCIINGLRGYSRTKEGRKYTLEWNTGGTESRRGMTYNDEVDSGEWHESPVQTNPLSLLPHNSKEQFLDEINEGGRQEVDVDVDIDPFSKEAFEYLKKEYADSDKVFSNATSDSHLRVVRQELDVGEGIGVLHVEDDGQPKERLVGSWMPEIMQEFQSRGRKNPQAFAYDGLLSQGNNGVSIVEDASQHIDIVQKLLNIPEEGMVKLDRKITMDVDTVLMLISNPDMGAELEQFAEEGRYDPLRALRRRMEKYEINYLTSLSLETELIRRLLLNQYSELDGEYSIRKPVELYDCRFTPHAIETAAMYDVLSRINSHKLDDLTETDKVLALDRGYHEEGNEKIPVEELDIVSSSEGDTGIPVTFTVEVLSELAQDNDIVLVSDVVEAMEEGFGESTLFANGESGSYKNKAYDVQNYSFSRIEVDMLDAMVGDKEPTEEAVQDYVDSVFAWEESDTDSSKDEDFDAFELREFEIQYLGKEEDDYLRNALPKKEVKDFREEKIINPINTYIYENKDEDFEFSDVSFRESPVLSSLIGDNDWKSVKRHYPNVKFTQWNDPPSGSETEELKEKTINRMVEEQDYTEEGAEKATAEVLREGEAKLEQIKEALKWD